MAEKTPQPLHQVFSYVMDPGGNILGDNHAKLMDALSHGYKVVDIVAVPISGGNSVGYTSITILVNLGHSGDPYIASHMMAK
jgi:hypothetical protein